MPTPSTDLIHDLSEECEFTGLAKYECSHCLGDDSKLERESDLILKGRPFPAQYAGRCTIDEDHPIRKGRSISRLAHRDNPFVSVYGFACELCIAEMPSE